ncbi:radical SAM protein [Kitasatospora sp. NPDC002040]|uniref:radical SAM/SPASM domain-containing protein n=1 Tax=Kitasatospora sp. NPDC002040 TaxID=3154661 RepID=UPI003333A703
MVDTYYPSPYLCVGDQEFTGSNGRPVVPVFRTSDATMLMVPAALADLLLRPGIPSGSVPARALASLLESGLVGPDPAAFRAAHHGVMKRHDSGRRTFVLLPTSYCNMGCEYCGQEHRRAALGRDHREAVLARVLRAAEDERTDHLHVAWFGGEPLMAFATLRSMAREIVGRVQERGVEFSSKITTNGALLDRRKLRALVHECGVTRFDITLDGPREIHDAHRPLKSGKPSFDRLVDFLAESVADPEFAEVAFILRTNVDVQNHRHVPEYLQEMARRGFAGIRNVTFQLAPIHSWGNDIDALSLSKDQVARLEIEWFTMMADLGLNFSALPATVVENTCVATTLGGEVIGSNGNVFSCTEHPLVPEHERDSVLIPVTALKPGQPRPPGRFDTWTDRVTAGGMPCSSCWLLPVCGGNCPKRWDEGEIACPSMKANLPQRLSAVARSKGLRPTGRTLTRTPTGERG